MGKLDNAEIHRVFSPSSVSSTGRNPNENDYVFVCRKHGEHFPLKLCTLESGRFRSMRSEV